MAEEQLLELLAFFKALADETRLKIAGLLAGEALSVEQLAAILGLRPSTVSHHLGILEDARLVEMRGESYYSVYSLRPNQLKEMSVRLLAKETLPQAADHLDLNAYDAKVVRDYSRRDGTLKQIPTQQKKLQAVLRHLLTEFKPERQYTEKQVNEIIARYHPDTASLRRAMIEFKLMQRAEGKYWRIDAL